MRDAYGTAVELPYLAKWAAGEPDDLRWLQGWCTSLGEHVKAGPSPRSRRTSTTRDQLLILDGSTFMG